MKTTSIIAISTLVASSVLSGVTGQMVPLQGSDGNPAVPSLHGLEQSIKQNLPDTPSLHGLEESIEQNLPAPRGIKDTPAPIKIKESRKRPAQAAPQEAAQIAPQPDVVHITKTRTEIVYPRPNPRLWKYLPEFPAHGPQGKIVAEFKIDDEGHFHKGRKHGGWDHQKGQYHRVAYKGEGYPHQHKGYHHNGEVYYEGGNAWIGEQGGRKHKGEEHKGPKEEGKDHHEEGKGDHKVKMDDKQGKDDKKKDHPRHGKGDEEVDKKKVNGFQPNNADGIIAAQNVNGTESASLSASADGAQKTAAAQASGIPKNAAASSSAVSSHLSSLSSARSSATSSSSTSASSNTHQVAVSFVAVMAAAAAWCLA